MSRKALSTRDDFEYWLMDMDDALERFLSGLPPQIKEKLDFCIITDDFCRTKTLQPF